MSGRVIWVQTVFGEEMRVQRARKRMTLREVGAITGHAVSYLSDIERGVRHPSQETRWRIADAIEMPRTDADRYTAIDRLDHEQRVALGLVTP